MCFWWIESWIKNTFYSFFIVYGVFYSVLDFLVLVHGQKGQLFGVKQLATKNKLSIEKWKFGQHGSILQRLLSLKWGASFRRIVTECVCISACLPWATSWNRSVPTPFASAAPLKCAQSGTTKTWRRTESGWKPQLSLTQVANPETELIYRTVESCLLFSF